MPDRWSAPPLLTRTLVAYLLSRFCSASAMTMLRAGVAWHVFSLTSSAFHLGLIGVVQFLPALGLMLVAGALADAHDRRRIMMVGADRRARRRPSCCGRRRRRGTVTRAPALRHHPGLVAARQHLRRSGARGAAADPGAARGLSARRHPRVHQPGAGVRDRSRPAPGCSSRPPGSPRSTRPTSCCCAARSPPSPSCAPGRSDGPRGDAVAARHPRGARSSSAAGRWSSAAWCSTCSPSSSGAPRRCSPIYAQDILHVGPRGYGLLSSSLEIGALVTSAVLDGCAGRSGGPARALLVAVGVYGAGHHRLRPVALVPALGRGLHAGRRRRPGERGDAQHGHPALDARRAARPRERGQPALHRRLEPARRRRVRLRRRAHQRAVRGGERRGRVPGGAGDRRR